MALMAKRKHTPGEPDEGGRKSPSRNGEPLNVWIRADLMASLRSLIEHTRPRTTKTAIVEEALEQYLSTLGVWSPPEEER